MKSILPLWICTLLFGFFAHTVSQNSAHEPALSKSDFNVDSKATNYPKDAEEKNEAPSLPKISWLGSLLYSYSQKSLEWDEFITLDGRRYQLETESVIDKEVVTPYADYRETNEHLYIPNLELFKEQYIRKMGLNGKIGVHVPKGTVYEENIVSTEKALLLALIGCIGLLSGVEYSFPGKIISSRKPK